METKLHSHDINEGKVMESHIKPNIHHVVDNPILVQTTPKEDKAWYEKLYDMIPSMKTLTTAAVDLAPIAGGLMGAYTGGPAGAIMGAEIGYEVEKIGEGAINMAATPEYAGRKNPVYNKGFD